MTERDRFIEAERAGHHLYVVRVSPPSLLGTTLVLATFVTDSHIDSVMPRATLAGIDRKEAMRWSAMDGMRMQLERGGFARDDLMEARWTAVEATAAEVIALQASMKAKASKG